VGSIKTNQDVLWKGIIENLFEDFLRFFYPDAIHEFDLSKGFEFLDKELAEFYDKSKSRRRYADKLVKVYTHHGQARWILIHIEVQGYRDVHFPERMFNYYYRILEKYQQEITALVIYTDKHPNFHPKEYVRSYLGTEVRYSFRTYKLLDKKLEDFANKSNPFAVVMETAWYGLKEDKLDEAHRAKLRIKLIRKLFELGYTKERINYLIAFIIRSVNFENPKIKRKFENDLDIILQKRKPMGIQEAIIEDARWQGQEEERKKFEQQQKTTILNLQKKGFPNEEIALIMAISTEEIERLLSPNAPKL